MHLKSDFFDHSLYLVHSELETPREFKFYRKPHSIPKLGHYFCQIAKFGEDVLNHG